MRQLEIIVKRGQGDQVIQQARNHEGTNPVHFEVQAEGEIMEMIQLEIPNEQVGSFLKEMEAFPEAHINLFPHSIFPMRPPRMSVAAMIKNVGYRSPIEVWLNGLQSIGSWKGFLGYSIAGAVVLWIGMFTNTIYLLVAAMLLAPFAGPAMNVAIATASGDTTLLWRNLARYLVALVTMITVTALLSLGMQQHVATLTMVSVSEVSAVAFFLPIVAGAAGALNLVQAENSSLVSGAAVGILVAASLSPPAGLIGMAVAIERYDLIKNAVFVLALQLVGINLAGALLFRLTGMNTQHARYQRGKKWLFAASMIVTTIALAGLLVWQFSTSPSLQRSTRSQQAVDVIQTTLEESHRVQLVEANVRFTRPRTGSQETLLGVIYVQPQDDLELPQEELVQQLTRDIQENLITAGFNVDPLIQVTVLTPLNNKDGR